jgi:hypothetical protein
MARRSASSASVRRVAMAWPNRCINSGTNGGPELSSTTVDVFSGCTLA